MYLGKVCGNVVSTVKHNSFNNRKILLVSPMQPDETVKPATMVAVDTVGAGFGDIVIVAAEGRSAAEILGFEFRIPLRSVIIGIVDHISLKIDKSPTE
jgi:ethanolamine utilization protein EutN